MNFINILIIGIIGACFGSFFNVCIYRLPRNENICFKPSHCPYCKQKINWFPDLIPIIGFLLLNGKCRFCHKVISKQYLLIELISAALFIILFITFGYSISFIKYTILFSILLIIGIIDLKHKIIPNVLIYSLIIIGFIFLIIEPGNLFSGLVAAILGFLIFYLIKIIAKLYYKEEALGSGDVGLVASLGLFLGIKLMLLTINLSFILGGVVAIFLLLTKQKNKNQTIPFGPVIIISVVLVLAYAIIYL